MTESRDSYWDLEAGAWVESSPATVPAQRPAEPADDLLDPPEVEQQYGVPV
jgi:hypothetical protein